MSLRLKLAVISASSLFLAVILIIAINIVDTGLIQSKSDRNALNANLRFFDYLANEQLVSMQPLINEISNEFDLRTAVKKNDRENIDKFAKRYLELTEGTGKYKTLELFSKDKRRLFLSDQRTRINNVTSYLDQLNSDETYVADLALLSSNEPIALLALPLRSRRKVIGYAVFTKSLDAVINKLAETNDSQVFLVTNDLEVMHNSNPEFPIKLDVLLNSEKQSVLDIIDVDEIAFEVTKQAINNSGNESLGYLLVAKDETRVISESRQFKLIAYSLTIIAIGLSFILMYWMVQKSVISPLFTIKNYLNKVASGDLSGKISHRFKGEFLEMAKDVEEVSSNLGAVVQRMQVEAESLANNTGMLNKTNEANIQLLEQQKSEAQNVATAMTQMTSTIQGVSDSARLAADQAVEADEMAGIGEKRVLEVIASIKQVSDDVESLKGTITQVAEHSNEIGSVIQIISGVAEQTNLLALNAAIEAARAGEQGRGFAVVAGEVRSLASKTQESTGKIREVIETLQKVTKKAVEDSDKSQIKSKETVSVAEQAGESLQRINRYIEKISMANAQIANAVKEQGLVSEEVNNNIIAISEMAERIHHGGVDTCQATNALARMADNMNDIASQFQVNHDSNVVHL
ncbi:MAG: methyl-accepting chemotaxis protein [Candidatus Thiodiazotropha sp.]|jgi:methyl-accepting chemotaxis protein